jgi:hypothetical protein
MRAHHPELFRALVTIPATFQKIHYKRSQPVHMVYRRPHLALDSNSNIRYCWTLLRAFVSDLS